MKIQSLLQISSQLNFVNLAYLIWHHKLIIARLENKLGCPSLDCFQTVNITLSLGVPGFTDFAQAWFVKSNDYLVASLFRLKIKSRHDPKLAT